MFKNAAAVSKGYEFELRALVTPDWMVGLNYTYTDAKFDNVLVPCNDHNGDGVPDVNGMPMVQPGKFVSECRSSTTLGSLPKSSVSAIPTIISILATSIHTFALTSSLATRVISRRRLGGSLAIHR